MTKRLLVRRPSHRLMRACCQFGLAVERGEPGAAPADRGAVERLLALPERSFALVTGPSGCGKSSVLRELRGVLRQRACGGCVLIDCTRALYIDTAVVDAIPLGLEPTLRLLAAVGLSDPLLLGRAARRLSTGEKARLQLARGLARAKRGGWLLVDEYLSTLDEATAAAVDVSFRRAAAERSVRVVAACLRGAGDELVVQC